VAVAVLTDSTAVLPPDVADVAGIRVVPIVVTVGGRTVRDGDISTSELLTTADHVTTSGPSPGEWLQALEDAGDASSAVIVTVAQALSSTFSSATVAASMSLIPVEVVDSATAAGGQALVVLAAADRASTGADHTGVAQAARVAAGQVRLIGCLESLDRLARSGRVPGIASSAMRRLGLRTLFELRDGRVRPLRPVPSWGAAIDRMVRTCAAAAIEGHVCDVMVLDADAPGLAAELAARVRERVPIGRDLAGSFGAAMMAHTGPGVVGLAWRWRPITP
jgi:DegV family protein with EDD domain